MQFQARPGFRHATYNGVPQDTPTYGSGPEDSKRGSTWDLVKPEGFIPPDIFIRVQFVSDDGPFAGARASEDDFEVLEPVTDVDVDALFGGADPKAPENVAVETDDIAF